MRTSNLLLLVAFAASLAACSMPEPQERASSTAEGADFMVDSIRGKVASTSYEDSFSLPVSRLYNYSICVKSLSHARPLTGQSFHIVEANKTVKADTQGCVNWSERMEFDYLSESIYIPVERTIKAVGFSRGSRTVRFGVNPWSHGENNPLDAVDLSKTEVAILKEQSSPVTRPLWMEDLRLSIADDRIAKGGLSMTYQLYGSPRLVLHNTTGERVLEVLKRGRFKAVLTLIQQDLVNGKEVRVPLARHEIDDMRIKNETLAIRFPVLLPNVPKSGQLFMGLELEPLGGGSRLKGFQAVYSMGDFRSIRTPNFLKVSPLVTEKNDFNLLNFLTPQSELASGEASQPHQQRASVEVDYLQFSIVQRGKESALKKQISYRIQACVRSGVDSDSLMSRPFKVTKTRFAPSDKPETVEIKTNHMSCLFWDEVLEYDYYDCQRFMKGEVTIANTDLGLNEKVSYYINPWNNGALFATDARALDQTKNLTLSCDPKTRLRAHIDIDGYSFSTKSLSHEVDNNLNLFVKKRLLFRMDPKVLIYSSLMNGLMEKEPLRDGPYFLRLAVVRNKDYDNNNTYVTHVEKLVKVLGGRVNEEIDVVSRDLKSMGNRNTLLAELHPVDPTKVKIGENGKLQLADGVKSMNDAIAAQSEIVSDVFVSTILLNESNEGKDFLRADPSTLLSYLLDKESAPSASSDLVSKIIRDGWEKQKSQLQQSLKDGDVSTFAKGEGLRLHNLKQLPAQAAAKAFSLRVNDVHGYNQRPLPMPQLWERAKQNAKASDYDATAMKDLLDGRWNDRSVETMCLYFLHEKLGSKIFMGYHRYLTLDCVNQAKKNPAFYFSLEKRRIVHEFGGSELVRGMRHSLKVGTSFNMQNSHSSSFSTQASVGLNAGVGGRFLNYITMGLSGSVSASWGVQDSQSQANSVSVGEDIGLLVTENILRLKVNASEKCVVIRLNPELFKQKPRKWYGMRDTNYATYLERGLSDLQKVEAVHEGLMLCSGEVDRTAFEVAESYYLINQEVKDSDVQDGEDERNRPFFIALRGSNDYQRFVTMIKANPLAPSSADAAAAPLKDVGEFLSQAFANTKTAPRQIIIKD